MRDRVLADMDLHFEGRVSGVEGEFRMVHVYTWDDGLAGPDRGVPATPTSARGSSARGGWSSGPRTTRIRSGRRRRPADLLG